VYSRNLGTQGVSGEERASFYAADGTLRATDWRWVENATAFVSAWKSSLEEYRYDALGRRIWVRMQRNCRGFDSSNRIFEATECLVSLVRRTVWNGSQELIEIQAPGGSSESQYWETDAGLPQLPQVTTWNAGMGDPNPYYGRVAYTPGRGLDKPLAVTRFDYKKYGQSPPSRVTIMPFWDGLGEPSIGVFTTGRFLECNPPSTGPCVGVVWPHNFTAYERNLGLIWDNWHGTLLERKRDLSGLEFRRSRYYDPQTGRFTQEDPIGLAGGANLYGFAGGDPVNHSDPFGLCIWDGCIAEFILGSAAVSAGIRVIGNLVMHRPAAENVMRDGVMGAGIATVMVGGYEVALARSAAVARLAPALPVLTSGRGHDMMTQAVEHLQEMPGAARVDAFRGFAQQITQANPGEWKATEMAAQNGTAFFGDGRMIAFDALGNMFKGSPEVGLTILRGGQTMINFDKLKPIQ
jgi:RHS repeat-associated protein